MNAVMDPKAAPAIRSCDRTASPFLEGIQEVASECHKEIFPPTLPLPRTQVPWLMHPNVPLLAGASRSAVPVTLTTL